MANDLMGRLTQMRGKVRSWAGGETEVGTHLPSSRTRQNLGFKLLTTYSASATSMSSQSSARVANAIELRICWIWIQSVS